MRKAATLVAVLLLACAAGSAAKAWGPDSYPDPKRDVNLCGRRGKKSSLCDPDKVISYDSANRVEGILKEIWEGSTPYVRAPCADKGYQGFQVAVALMRRLESEPGETAAEAAHRMAKELHAKWGVGAAACDNGVLLLLAVDDRQVYISTGAGAQKMLPNAHLGGIVAQMRKPLRAGDYDGAVEQAVVDIGLGLAGRAPSSKWEWFPLLFLGGVAGFLLYSCWQSFKRRRQYRDCRSALRRVKEEQEKLRTREWSKPRTCPICLDTFTTDPEAPTAPPPPPGSEEDPAAPLLPVDPLPPSEVGSSVQQASTSAVAVPASCGLRKRSCGKSLAKDGGGCKAGQGGKERLPISLPCGHTFCEPCIERWLERSSTCPICRQRVGVEPNAGPSSSSSAAAGAQHAQRGLLDPNAELVFRLLSLRQQYPGFITPALIDTWSTEAQATGTFDWEGARDFQLNDPATRAQHQSAGSSGNSMSFGGGGGGGGGGAGGSW